VLPVGGWQNVLKLQSELLAGNVLGTGKAVFSILDGDVQSIINKEYRPLKKLFLPINSVEKYLLNVLATQPVPAVKKQINDRFFQIQSIDDLINAYKRDEERNKKALLQDFREDHDGKRLYHKLLKNMQSRQITEDMFISGLYEIVIKNVKFDSFYENLKKELT
jgi:hypothetical protein